MSFGESKAPLAVSDRERLSVRGGATRRRLALVVSVAATACTDRSIDNGAESARPEETRTVKQAVVTAFAAGSLVIPMDTTYQDNGMLKAFGLVYTLVKRGVPVRWAILTPKAQGATDFTASGVDFQTGAVITDFGYRGGPFIIDSADRATAVPIVQAWHGAGNVTTVHDMTAAFSADVRSTITVAPRIAVFVDGYETILFGYLNAAGITDSAGQAWPAALDATGVYAGYPDILNATETKGPVNGSNDGALFRAGGVPDFCQFAVAHHPLSAIDNEVRREVRQWLASSASVHAFMECEAILAFENNVATGRFLSTAGVKQDSSTAPTPLTNRTPDNAISQYDGTIQANNSAFAMDSLTKNGGSWKATVATHLNRSTSALGTRVMWLSGNLDGNAAQGKVTYLTGHQYPTTLPISASAQTNGSRLFLQSLLDPGCTTAVPSPTLTFTKSAPAYTNGSSITFTISYGNTAGGTAEGAVIKDAIPAGTTFVSATGGGTFASGVVTWTLGDLAPGASGSVSVTVSVASDGTYTNEALLNYRVGPTAKALASNTTTTVRDTAEPTTTIVSGPANPTNSPIATFDFSSDDPLATFECNLDAAGWAACSDPVTFTGLSETPHTLDVRAKDAAGNSDGTPATHTWTVDTTPPDTSFSVTPSDPSNTPNPTFGFTSTESPATFECKLDSGSWAPCTNPKSYSGLGDGSHTFQVRAMDAATNTDPSPASYTWTIDATAPDTSITSNPPAATPATSATFVFTSTETPSTFECKLDTGAWTPCTSPQSYSGLSEATHTFQVRATDAATNTDPTPAPYTWSVDATAPNTTITSNPPLASNSTSASFAFTSDESPVTYECRFDTGPWASCTSPQSFSGIADGSHTFAVRATDAAGNMDGSPASYTWTVDTVAPDTSFLSTPPSASNSSAASFSFTSLDGTATFECRLDSGSWSVCTSPASLSGLADGSHTYDVRAKDPAGNTDASPASYTWTVDTAIPETSFTATPPVLSNTASASFSFSSNEVGATFDCKLDTGAWTACASPRDLTGLADGSHTFWVRAKDAAGNVDASPAPYTWAIDTVVPDTNLTSTPPSQSASGNASFGFSSLDVTATFECKLDTGAWGVCTSPTSYSSLADGVHAFQVRAKDPAGNVDASPESYTWTIDTGPPDTSITSSPPTLTNGTSANFAFTSNEGSVTYECKLDAAAWSSCTSPVSFTGLSAGSHTFLVRATDAAGNVDATPASYPWTIDTTAPDTSLTSTPPAVTSSTSATFVFSSLDGTATFECRLDGAAWAACTSPTDYTGFADGSHAFDVRAKDPAGNVDATPASYTWSIDTTAPDTSITASPAATTAAKSAAFEFASADTAATFECRVDGAPWSTCTSPATYSALAEGNHTFDVRAKDPAGNVDATPASFTWTIDLTAPDTAIATKPAAISNVSSPSFGFTSNEVGATFECKLDGAALWTACATPVTFAGVADGSHSLDVRAKDVAGNLDSTPATYTWVVDTVAPDTTIDSGPAALVATSSASVTFSSNDTAATFECKLDGAPSFTACISPFALTGLSDGPHSLEIRARDQAGNTDATPATHAWTVDTSAPVVAIVSGPPAQSGSASATFDFSSNETGVTFECKLDSATGWTACTDPVTFNSLVDGSHTLSVRAKDAAGNVSTSPASQTWIVAPGAPNTSVTSGPSNPTDQTSATFVFSSDLAGVSFECRLDGASSFTACPGTATFPGLGDGEHTLQVRAKTNEGVVDPTPATWTWIVDTDATPGTTIVSGPSSPTSETAAAFDFSSDVAGVSFECKLDSATTFTACTDPAVFNGLVDGTHLLAVRAKDAAGNVDPTPATWTWIVDTAATPETTVALGPPTTNAPSNATFSFSSDVGDATFECRLDTAEAFGACANPVTYTALLDGPHTLEVRAKATTGAVDPTPATWSWTVGSEVVDGGPDAGGGAPSQDAGVSADGGSSPEDAGAIGGGVSAPDGGESLVNETPSGSDGGCAVAATSNSTPHLGFALLIVVGAATRALRRRVSARSRTR
ncbi:MAG: DUF11 domain-containing protein [Deltaproteobacteria bacterium]|nr:DUF11 domain-containing protein [Deltaproteobacteria bacterium]